MRCKNIRLFLLKDIIVVAESKVLKEVCVYVHVCVDVYACAGVCHTHTSTIVIYNE